MPEENRLFEALGLDEIMAALISRANTAGGKAVVSSIAPFTTLKDAEIALDETEAMIRLMELRPDFDIAPCEDIRGLLTKTEKSQALTGEELRFFIPLLKTGEKLREMFETEGVNEENPLWIEIPPIHGLADLLEESIDEDGNVKPDATPEIERLHKSVNSLRRSIREKAESLLKDSGISSMLQDEYVTLRENRFVLPVKAEHKSHVEGIIHDSSNSGQTFFIEPKALVGLNNKLRTAEMELADEVARLLGELSAMIAEEADSIKGVYEAVTGLDEISARARLALELQCSRPILGKRLYLKNAVNPVMALEDKEAVANDMEMPEGARALVISGPNTGGKTVALKTIGALSLMAKMGLFITAGEGSSLPFYNEVYVDIGDSQSIADDLSTFSAHLVTINGIIKSAKEGSLALLDELMVSTDPREGSALAVAVLDKLVAEGLDVVVTTHFNELKTLALSQPAYYNVSMEFDEEDASPTYRMVGGVPGASSALMVAGKLGMDRDIVASAKARLEGGDERIEKALEELSKEKVALERARREAQAALSEAERANEEARKIRDEIDERKKELAREAKRKLSMHVASAKREISEMLERLKTQASDRGALKKARESLEKMAAESREAAAPRESVPKDKLKEGDEVYVVPLEKRGKLASAPCEGKAEVAMGAMRVMVRLDDLIGVGEGGEVKRQVYRRPPVRTATGETQAAPAEIDLRGARAEEAVDRVEKFLDSAFNSGRERLRIIHGKGTGALREAIREYLAISPYVETFEGAEDREGGSGVTIVTLKS